MANLFQNAIIYSGLALALFSGGDKSSGTVLEPVRNITPQVEQPLNTRTNSSSPFRNLDYQLLSSVTGTDPRAMLETQVQRGLAKVQSGIDYVQALNPSDYLGKCFKALRSQVNGDQK